MLSNQLVVPDAVSHKTDFHKTCSKKCILAKQHNNLVDYGILLGNVINYGKHHSCLLAIATISH